MHRPLVAYDGIAVAELIFYLFALAGSIFLCFKHGFTKDAGWRALIILSLARIIGASLRLATISDPTNEDLYIGWMTLNGIGLSKHQRLIELVLLVALILLIVGGTQSNFTITNGQPKVHYSTISHVSIALLIVVLVLVCLEVLLAYRNQGYVAQGEHRIILVIVLCMPFIIVRLVYSCLLVFGGITSTPWLYLGLSSLMEMIVTVISIVLGVSLEKVAKEPVSHTDEEMNSMGRKENH
ncbi:hypothetical protein PT974_10664 [Cladobotryum mycophilum]|uniref:DUF7702 domain-containing protein n=1 Tax=Cladobotryum mycophilum TaxID=491253 RepID=A0ABR0SB14_9HYPO